MAKLPKAAAVAIPADKRPPRVLEETAAESETAVVSLWIEQADDGYELCAAWSGGLEGDIAALAVTAPGVYNSSWIHPFDEFRLGAVFLWSAEKNGIARIRMTPTLTRAGWNTCKISFLIVPGPVEVAWGPSDLRGFGFGSWRERWPGSKHRMVSAAELQAQPQLMEASDEHWDRFFPDASLFALPTSKAEVVRTRIERKPSLAEKPRTTPSPRVGLSVSWDVE